MDKERGKSRAQTVWEVFVRTFGSEGNAEIRKGCGRGMAGLASHFRQITLAATAESGGEWRGEPG